MAFDLSALTQYVEQRRLPLIGEAVLKSKSIKLMNVQPDVKYKSVINLFNTDPTLQVGGCGWNADGDVTLTQRVITAPLIKVNMSFCDKDMLKYWTGYEVKVASTETDSLPFEEYFTKQIVEKVQAKNEKMVWQGDETLGVDGLIELMTADDTVVKPTIASGTTAFDAIKAVYMAIPEQVLDGASILVGADVYRQFIMELMEKNLYHYSADNQNEEIYFPGTNTRIIALNGLNGTNKIVACRLNNLFVGVDMMGDAEDFKIWKSLDFQEIRLAINYNIGFNYAFGNEIVMGTLS